MPYAGIRWDRLLHTTSVDCILHTSGVLLFEHMVPRRNTFNPKRRLATRPPGADLEHLSSIVNYGGNPEHKRNPGDFGLTPPSSPRADKTLCDGVRIFRREMALDLLRKGVLLGMLSAQTRNGFPQYIWAVTDDGEPLEAQLENQTTGTYHGYPMPLNDPFRQTVLDAWRGFQ